MQMLMDSSETDGQPIKTVHIGDVHEVKMSELAEKMFAVVAWKPETLDMKTSPVGSVKRRLADISKLQRLTGWRPEISLSEGLKRTYEWYLINPKKEK